MLGVGKDIDGRWEGGGGFEFSSLSLFDDQALKSPPGGLARARGFEGRLGGGLPAHDVAT